MSSQDRNEIRRVFEEVYADNVRTKNLQGYGEMFTEDALSLFCQTPKTFVISKFWRLDREKNCSVFY